MTRRANRANAALSAESGQCSVANIHTTVATIMTGDSALQMVFRLAADGLSTAHSPERPPPGDAAVAAKTRAVPTVVIVMVAVAVVHPPSR